MKLTLALLCFVLLNKEYKLMQDKLIEMDRENKKLVRYLNYYTDINPQIIRHSKDNIELETIDIIGNELDGL